MSKLTKKLSLLFVTLLMVLGASNVAMAAEPKKELALYNDGWVGFRYVDADGIAWLELSYNGKSVFNLQNEGYTVELRHFSESPYKSSTSRTTWYTSERYPLEIISAESLDTIALYGPSKYNLYQFRILDENSNVISTSDRILSDDSIDFPAFIASTPYNFDEYNYEGKSIKITLKFSEPIKALDSSYSPYVDTAVLNNPSVISVLKPFFTTNLEYENFSEVVNINGKEYNWEYSIVTFICNFPYFEYETPEDTLNTFSLTLDNLCGLYSNNNTCEIYYKVYRYSDISNYYVSPVKFDTNVSNTLQKDETVSLTVSSTDSEISLENLLFISSNEKVATVDSKGVVTAKENGEAYIYVCNNDDIYDYCKVTVDTETYDEGDVTIFVDSISLNTLQKSLKIGETFELVSTILPSNATNKDVVWKTSNSAIATVDSNGKVTAKKAGSVTITATSSDNTDIYATCKITVVNPVYKVTSLALTTPTTNVKVGSKIKVNGNVYPFNATNKGLTWKSSNTNYATVDAYGTVTIKAAGAGKTVTITAIAKDGSKVQKSITLKIDKMKVTKINLTGKKSVKAGKSLTLKVVVKPANVSNKKLKWSVSNKKYAAISKKGVLKAKKAGKGKKVKVTVSATDGSGIKATMTIKIK